MSKDIKKALEHCVEWKCDNCPNGDDLGSGETVCRGRLLPQVLEYVADLEAKLAEKYQAIEGLQEINKSLGQTCNNDAKEIKRLREELHTANQETLHFQNKYFAENQTAIDELEKVKVKLNEEINNANVLLDPIEYEDYHELLGVIRGYKLSIEQINQRIKSLKGEK